MALAAQRNTCRSFGSRSAAGSSTWAGSMICAMARYVCITPATVWPRNRNRSTRCGRESTSSNSARISSLVTSPIRRDAPRSNREADGPLQSSPEIRIFVSATAFTVLAVLGAHGVHLRLDFVHRHRFIVRAGAHLFDHLAVGAQRLIQFQFAFDQAGDFGGVEQALGPGLGGHSLGQIKLDNDAQIASVAEGYGSEPPGRSIHTDKGPTFVPRASHNKHLWTFKVKPGGAR